MRKIALFLFFPLLISCTDINKIQSGFNGFGNGDFAPCLVSGIETNKEQRLDICCTVYIGHVKDFYTIYVQDFIEPFYDDFSFGITREIIVGESSYSKELLDINLEDFYSDDKYDYSVKNKFWRYELVPNFSFDDIFSYSILPQNGLIYYDFCLLNQKREIIDFNFECGIYTGDLCFERNDETVKFY